MQSFQKECFFCDNLCLGQTEDYSARHTRHSPSTPGPGTRRSKRHDQKNTSYFHRHHHRVTMGEDIAGSIDTRLNMHNNRNHTKKKKKALRPSGEKDVASNLCVNQPLRGSRGGGHS